MLSQAIQLSAPPFSSLSQTTTQVLIILLQLKSNIKNIYFIVVIITHNNKTVLLERQVILLLYKRFVIKNTLLNDIKVAFNKHCINCHFQIVYVHN